MPQIEAESEATEQTLSSFILSYEMCGIRWNIVVIAKSHKEAKLQVPKYASKVNAEWIP